MIETLLRSIINSGLWKAVLTPMHSTIKSSLIRKHHIPFPSSRDTKDLVGGSISDISISCLISLLTNLFTRSHDIASSMTESHACKLRRYNYHRVSSSGPSSINPSRGWTNPALGAHASTYSTGIPEHTFSVTILPSDG
jgi:hypothetical protein